MGSSPSMIMGFANGDSISVLGQQSSAAQTCKRMQALKILKRNLQTPWFKADAIVLGIMLSHMHHSGLTSNARAND